jgi:predicted HicB family RNase H-like nuclease
MSAAARLGEDTVADEDRKQLTLRVPAEVHKKMRILAALNEMTMTEYFISLVEAEYEKRAKDTGPVQLRLPV